MDIAQAKKILKEDLPFHAIADFADKVVQEMECLMRLILYGIHRDSIYPGKKGTVTCLLPISLERGIKADSSKQETCTQTNQ